MQHLELPPGNHNKLQQAFVATVTVDAGLLAYNRILQWNSTVHMPQIAELDYSFLPMLDTDDIFELSLVDKARETFASQRMVLA